MALISLNYQDRENLFNELSSTIKRAIGSAISGNWSSFFRLIRISVRVIANPHKENWHLSLNKTRDWFMSLSFLWKSLLSRRWNETDRRKQLEWVCRMTVQAKSLFKLSCFWAQKNPKSQLAATHPFFLAPSVPYVGMRLFLFTR